MKAIIIALLLFPLGASLVAAPKKRTPKPDPTCEVGLTPGKYSDKSIFRANSIWTTDDGKDIKLDTFRGKPVVIALFFSSCEHSCPFIARDMKAMQSALSKGAKAKVEFVLASIDPERDSPEAMKAFRTKYNLTGKTWTLMRGEPKSVSKLAETLGFSYSPGSKIQFAHSIMITVLNGEGEVAHQQVGLGVDRRGAIATLEKLAAAKPKS